MFKTTTLSLLICLVLFLGTSSSFFGQQTNSPIVPDPKMSPGDVLPVTATDICVSGYTKKVRDVPNSVKEAVYKEYGINNRQPREYEIDHIISLELGASNIFQPSVKYSSHRPR